VVVSKRFRIVPCAALIRLASSAKVPAIGSYMGACLNQ
jgi:hypothetical protein